MSEQSRKRGALRLPGEGTGIRGQDPLVFLEPGDDAELDRLLLELKKDSEDGDPLYVDYSAQIAQRRAAANSQGTEAGGSTGKDNGSRGDHAGEGAGEGGDVVKEKDGGARAVEVPKGRKRGVNPRWLMFATVAIVGTTMTLLLVLILMRLPGAQEGAREAAVKGEDGAKESAAAAANATATAGVPAAANPETVNSSEAGSAPAMSAAPAPSSTPTATSQEGGRLSPSRAKVNPNERDPYEMPQRLESGAPTSLDPSKSAPAATVSPLEQPATSTKPSPESPEAVF